jgi:hypothetical protein
MRTDLPKFQLAEGGAAPRRLVLVWNGGMKALLSSSSSSCTINFTITNPTLNPSAAFVRLSSSNTIEIEATGVSPYSTFVFRWGDYSWAALDPAGVHIWMDNEYVPAVSDQAPIANWGTEIFEQ